MANGLIEDLRNAYTEGQEERVTFYFLNLVNDPTQTAFHCGRMRSEATREDAEVSGPPFAVDPLDEQMVKEAVGLGVHCRLLIEEGPMDEAHRDRLEEYRAAGVETRFHPKLPLKLALFDNKCGLVALLDPVLTKPSWTSVIFEHNGFAEAMSGLFENYWSKGL